MICLFYQPERMAPTGGALLVFSKK